MSGINKETALKELQKIPGVGKVIAQDLWDLGFRSVGELKDRHPQQLYEMLCARQGAPVDRCMLYVFRCAVYYASRTTHDPGLLKWWHWKDRTLNECFGEPGTR